MKRILDYGSADFRGIERKELLEAILRAEGRTILCEALWPASPLADGISNSQLVTAFGADLVLLKHVLGQRTREPEVPSRSPQVGINVEPSDDVPEHRRASRNNLGRLQDADFVVVTANPGCGGWYGGGDLGCRARPRNDARSRGSSPARCTVAADSGLVGPSEIDRLARVADAVLIPAPGTVPGSRESVVADLVDAAHAQEALAIMTIGTSQEGADAETVRTIGLGIKRAGGDILHLGDAGVSGITEPMNILAASLAIRGPPAHLPANGYEMIGGDMHSQFSRSWVDWAASELRLLSESPGRDIASR